MGNTAASPCVLTKRLIMLGLRKNRGEDKTMHRWLRSRSVQIQKHDEEAAGKMHRRFASVFLYSIYDLEIVFSEFQVSNL